MKITDEQFLNMYDAGQNVVGEIEKPTQTPTEEAPVEANFTRRLQAYAERGSEILGFQLPVGPILNPNFDLASNIPEKHWKARDRYVGADSIEDVNKITARLDRELENTKIVQQSGWEGTIGEATFGLISPTTFIAGAGIVRAGSKLGTIGKTALASSGVAAGSIGLQEYVLQQQQAYRPIEESIGNTVGAAFIGGILGAGAGALIGRTEKEILQSQIGRIITDQKLDVITNEAGEVVSVAGNSVGAKQVNYLLQLQQEGLANISEGATKVLSLKGLGLAGPNISSKVSKSAATRTLGNNFFDNSGLMLAKNLDNIRTDRSASIDIDIYNTALAKISKSIEKEELVKWGGNYDTLSQAVARRGISGVAGDPIVEAVYGKLQAEVLRLGKEMQVRKMLPEMSNEDMLKYFPMRWENNKVSLNRASVVERLTNDFTSQAQYKLGDLGIKVDKIDINTDIHQLINDRIKELRKTGASEEAITKLKDAKKEIPKDLERIKESADDTAGKLSGEAPYSAIDSVHEGMSKPGFTKQRVLTVDYNNYTDVLNMDGIGNMFNYMYKANRAIQIDDMLKRSGFENFTEYRNQVAKDINEYAKIDPNIAKNKDKILKQELDLAKDLIDIATGRILHRTKADAALRYLRKYETVTLLGGVTVSSIPDLAMPIFKHGLSRTINDGYLPLIKSLKTAKLAREELQDFDVATELLTNGIYRQMSEDTGDLTFSTKKSKLEQQVDQVMDTFGKASGITFWNNFHQGMAGQMSIARTIRALRAGSNISAKEKTRLLSLGIGEHEGQQILESFSKYGQEYKGSFITNHSQWNTEVRDMLGQSVYRDVHSTIIRPSSGDIPLVMQKYELGKTVFQFKSFVSAATNKILISGIQRRDAQVLQGFIALNFAGMMTHNIKKLLKGEEVETDPYTALKEGAFRSGWPGWIGEAALFLPGVTSTKYASRGIKDATVGPGFSHAWNLAEVGYHIAGEQELSDRDKKTLVRSMPYNNLFYIRSLVDKVFKDD